jgi:hypothetical protein
MAACPCGGGCPRCVDTATHVNAALASPAVTLDPGELARIGNGWPAHLPAPQFHTGAAAARSAQLLGAHAYQSGPHLVFGSGQYRRGTPAGDQLLRHELAHVAQSDGRSPTRHRIVPKNDQTEFAASTFAADPHASLTTLATAAAAPTGLRLERNPQLDEALHRVRQIPLVYTDAATVDEILSRMGSIDLADRDNSEPLLTVVMSSFGLRVFDALNARLGGAAESSSATAPATHSAPPAPHGPAAAPAHAADIQALATVARARPDLSGHIQDALAITGFALGFLDGAQAEIPPEAFANLDRETRESPATFELGNMAGLIAGAGREVWGAIEGLIELAGFLASLTPGGLMHRAMDEAVAYASDPGGYTQRRAEEARQARDIAMALIQLAQTIHDDPAFLLVHGNELGLIVGHQAGQWFTDDFMHRSTFDKGETIGEIEGRVIIEIAMLFIGPEEWVARGGAVIGEGVRIGGELMEAVRVAMEGIPALRRIMEARGLVRAAEDTVEAGRAVGGAGHVIEDLSQVTHGTSELAHAGEGAGDAARTTEHAAGDARDNVIDLQAERERRAALARARTQQVARRQRLAAGAEGDTPMASAFDDEEIAEVMQQEQSRGVDSDRALDPGDLNEPRSSRHARLGDASLGSPSEILGRRLRAAGFDPPGPGYEAHHIIPIDDPRAAHLQELLESRGIDINSPDNGVWLPRGADTPNVGGEFRHEFTFDDEYFETINEILTAPTESGRPPSTPTLRLRLRNMRTQMMSGRMPSL